MSIDIISIDTLPDNVLLAMFTVMHMTINSKKKGKGCGSHWYTHAGDGGVLFLEDLNPQLLCTGRRDTPDVWPKINGELGVRI